MTTSTKNIEAVYRLTPVQQGMLFHTLYEAGDAAIYLQQLTWTIRRSLDGEAFKRAWDRVVARHAALRTFFLWENRNEPIQIVCRGVNTPWEYDDWSGQANSDRRARLQSLLNADQFDAFRLNQAPLMRFKLIRLDRHSYQIVWTFHHLILDGWSLPIVMKEATLFYDAAKRGEDIEFEKPKPYKNYITWLSGQDKQNTKSYWTERLAGFHEPVAINVDKTLRPTSPKSRCEATEYHISSDITDSLRKVCKRHRVTLNIVIQAAWSLLLSRYSGRDDVVFGMTEAGRSAQLAGIESMVGVFINTVPVRTQIASDATMADVLQGLMADYVQQQLHTHAALADIQAWSDVPGGTSLFNSLVILENYPVDASLQNSDWHVHDFQSYERTNYPLTLLAMPGDRLHLKLSYDAGLFEGGTAGRILGHLANLLAAIATDTQQLALKAAMLSATERHQLLKRWNDTDAPYDLNKPLHELIERQAARLPDAPAVVFPALGTGAREDRTLSYRALNGRANRVAAWLTARGVGVDVPVAICAERSLELVIGLLGILKSGGAYVPLDPNGPQQRLLTMLRDANVPAILTQSHLRDALPDSTIPILCLDQDEGAKGRREDRNPAVSISPENLAYVIYTSGSTGKPKGAMNTHRAICNRLLWMQEVFELTDTDKVLQKTPFTFDVSVWEFFWPLTTGATLVMAKPGGHQDASYLADLIVSHQITTMHFVPSMLKLFLDEPRSANCTSLKRVISSGEALPHETQARFRDRMNCELHNLYGPTEAAVDVTFWPCERDGNGPSVPIGRPIANTQIFILDDWLEPTPIGVPGELYIGGVNLARGYLNQPALTSERFVANPFAGKPGERMYKTGDRACYLADGSIQYLNRLDNQVKLRGFRIELGEIEAVLTNHPGVKDAAVIVREDEPGRRRLVAYLLAVGSELPSTKELHQYLRRRLPDYCIPAAFVWLASMPTSRNGKLDRAALPCPDPAQPALDPQFIIPQTETERTIAALWQEVLQIDRVGLHDNFFELGGNSLLLLPIQGKLRSGLAPDLSLVELFQYPTVHSLAAFIASSAVEPDAVGSAADRGQIRIKSTAAVANRRQVRRQHRNDADRKHPASTDNVTGDHHRNPSTRRLAE